MEANDAIANTIRNIIAQINHNSSIRLDHFEGRFISERQIAVLEECCDQLEQLESVAGIDTPTSSQITAASSAEDGIVARRLALTKDIKKKQTELAFAARDKKSNINKEIGALLSERAKVDKLLKQIQEISFE